MSEYAFQNPDLTFETRADDLIERLTLEEKSAQMVHGARGVERLGSAARGIEAERFEISAGGHQPAASPVMAHDTPDIVFGSFDVIGTTSLSHL